MKFNPVYLWYSIVLLFPPLHELGHVVIAWMLGDNVLGLQWNLTKTSRSNIFQSMWEYSMLLPSVCVIIWAYIEIKHMRINNKMVVCRI